MVASIFFCLQCTSPVIHLCLHKGGWLDLGHAPRMSIKWSESFTICECLGRIAGVRSTQQSDKQKCSENRLEKLLRECEARSNPESKNVVRIGLGRIAGVKFDNNGQTGLHKTRKQYYYRLAYPKFWKIRFLWYACKNYDKLCWVLPSTLLLKWHFFVFML